MRPCPACGGPLSAWRLVSSSDPVVPGDIALSRCAMCATAVTDTPVPRDDLHDSGAYGGGAPRGSVLARPILASFDRSRLRLVADAVPPPARLLDAGAGRGRFVAAARAAGYEATGLEPSARGVTAARAIHGLDLIDAGIDTAAVDAGSLDVITLWHVLEHLEAPAAALARLATWLRPGGALVVGVPNLASLQARIGGPRWFHLDVPRHRTHFTPAGLRTLVASCGLTPGRTRHVRAEHNPFGMWQSAVNRATRQPSYLFHVLKRNAPIASPDLAITIAALPLAPLAALAELGAGATRRGGTIAIVATRRAP